MPTALLFLIVLLLVVVVHEAGHFFAAKQVGMRVKEFAFGFPPRLFGIKKGETEYSFNAIPLGGYVAIDGENGSNDANDPRLFTNKSKLAQAWVLFAGPLMNILLAFVLLTISFMVGYGDSNIDTKNVVILGVLKDSPAEVAGIKSGDKIISVNSNDAVLLNPTIDQFIESVNNSNGDSVKLTISRKNKEEVVSVNPNKDGGSYKLGVNIGTLESKKLGFFASIKEGFVSTIKLTYATAAGFIHMIASLFTGESLKGALTGPVGIAREVGVASTFGFAYLLYFISIISINLGVLNMFPFPALDGGRLLFLGIEKVKGSKINPNTANIVNTIGFGLLILLMIVITIKDIIKLF